MYILLISANNVGFDLGPVEGISTWERPIPLCQEVCFEKQKIHSKIVSKITRKIINVEKWMPISLYWNTSKMITILSGTLPLLGKEYASEKYVKSFFKDKKLVRHTIINISLTYFE